MNTITITFTECDPPPTNGYNIQFRLLGSNDPYIDAGNFINSPAVFVDDTNPDGSQYEGIIRSDNSESGESGSNFCNDILWNTEDD